MTSRAGTGVSILEGRDTTLSTPQEGNVYLNDNQSPSQAPGAPRPSTAVRIEWKGDTVLLVHQHPTAHIVFAAIRFAGVTIQYDTVP